MSDEVALDQVRQEISVLQECQKMNRVNKLIDVIEETETITVIYELFEDLSLR